VGPFGIIDFPVEVSLVMKELGLSLVGKVYLPRRSDIARGRIISAHDGMKPLVSDCREMLTFQKA